MAGCFFEHSVRNVGRVCGAEIDFRAKYLFYAAAFRMFAISQDKLCSSNIYKILSIWLLLVSLFMCGTSKKQWCLGPCSC